nr:unnamed protein product [Digitaria exilis]
MSFRRPAARRLTLAPTPAPPGSSNEEAVHWAVQAALPHGGQAAGKLSADPLAGLRPRTYGSRFWSLAEEESSDEGQDEVEDEQALRHVQPGRPSAESACTASNAPATRASAGELTPNGCLSSGVVGSTPASKERARARGRKMAGATQQKKGPKPWRGPLPAARTSPTLTLADALAKARHNTTMAGRSNKSSGDGPDRSSVSSPTPATVAGNGLLKSQNSNFQSARPWARDLGEGGRVAGTVCGPGRSIQIRLGGRTAQFTFTAGLCALLAGAGRPRALKHPAYTPSTQNASSDSRIQSASTRQSSPANTRVAAADGEAAHRCKAMDRQGAGGHGRGYDMSRGRDEEQFVGGGGGFHGGGLGFDPGYGEVGGGRGRGWPRSGFRPRGSRGFAPRRGGFPGRPGRGGGAGRHGHYQRGPAAGGGSAPTPIAASDNQPANKPPPGPAFTTAGNVREPVESAHTAGSGAARMDWDQETETEEKEMSKAGKKEKS